MVSSNNTPKNRFVCNTLFLTENSYTEKSKKIKIFVISIASSLYSESKTKKKKDYYYLLVECEVSYSLMLNTP